MNNIKMRMWNKLSDKMEYTFGILCKSGEVERENAIGELMLGLDLKDKNGKEIYEGDILKFCDNHRGYSGTIIIENKKNTSCGCCGFITGYDHDEWNSEPKYVEVMGNIYENPDLVKLKSICKRIVNHEH